MTSETSSYSDTAVLIPCLNEAPTIHRVVTSFMNEIPHAQIFVIDNGSTDATISEALSAGATVVRQSLPGKGNAIRKAFATIDAEVYVMVDGDGTYDSSSVKTLISIVRSGAADLAIANRRYSIETTPQRKGHVFGNRFFSWIVRRLFAIDVNDVLSGYRAMSKRFVKSFPMMSRGFEVEVEIAAHASLLHAEVKTVDSAYFNRDELSSSKLRTLRDGLRIVLAVFRIYRSFAPARFFGSLSGLCFLLSIFIQSQSFNQTSTADSVSIGLVVICVVFFTIGVVLNSQSRIQRQIIRLAYIGTISSR